MRYRHIQNQNFKKEEINSLYELFVEEENIAVAIENKKSDQSYNEKLYKYGQSKRWLESDIGTVSTANFKEFIKNYDFIVVKDKNDRVLGYLCYEIADFTTKTNTSKVYIIKHIYISNSIRCANMDWFLFSIIEKLAGENTIYCFPKYAPTSTFNGYINLKNMYSFENNGFIRLGNSVFSSRLLMEKSFSKHKER